MGTASGVSPASAKHHQDLLVNDHLAVAPFGLQYSGVVLSPRLSVQRVASPGACHPHMRANFSLVPVSVRVFEFSGAELQQFVVLRSTLYYVSSCQSRLN